jgi:O-antigen ligase
MVDQHYLHLPDLQFSANLHLFCCLKYPRNHLSLRWMARDFKLKISDPLHRIQHWSLVAMAFILPFPHKIPHPVLYVVAVLWLAEIIRTAWAGKSARFLYQRFISHGSLLTRISAFLLIFCYIAGVLYSENLSSARFELEKKSLLLLFPMVIMTMDRVVFDRLLLKRILAGFITGLFLVTSFYMVMAQQRFALSGSAGEFFYSSLSHWHHPGYLSLYVVFALGVTAWLLPTGRSRFKRYQIVMAVVLMLWWLVIIFLLSSKIGFLSLLIALLLIFMLMFKTLPRRTMVMLTVGFLLALAVVSSLFSGTVMARFEVMRQRGLEVPDLATIRRADGIVIRIISWEIAFQQWKAAPVLGVGTGDYHDELWDELASRDLLEVFGGFKNAHNQFLQTAVTCGTIGFIALLMWILAPLFALKPPRPWLNIFFITLMAVNLMVESMLETQAGVMFIVFFHIILQIVPQSRAVEPTAA